MILKELKLKNIGPFREAYLDFPCSNDETGHIPVTIITGENGTGKTMVLDAIRSLLAGVFSRDFVKREITSSDNFSVEGLFMESKEPLSLKTDRKLPNPLKPESGKGFRVVRNDSKTEEHRLGDLFKVRLIPDKYSTPDWVIDYWTSAISEEGYEVKSLISPSPEEYLSEALSGVHRSVEVTELITYFDYLRASEEPKEKELGTFLFETLKAIISEGLLNGKLKHVSRTTLTPILEQNGTEVRLDQLSSGNLYLIQRFVSMLGKMYAVAQLNDIPTQDMLKTKGLLLIDEAENHLHPKWQKTFLASIRRFFPNLQIILTTHSPFIVASVPNAKIYVCEPREGYVEICDRSESYTNKPVDEILLTPVFGTQPFRKEIEDLIRERKAAIDNGDKTKRKEVEAELLRLNPEHFSYFNLEEQLEALRQT